MTKPTLLYFPIRGRGEPIRLLLHAKGIEFNESMPDREQMKSNLAQFPFAVLPVYEDGKIRMSQSNSILRYLAREHGMYGANSVEAAVIDQLADGIEDLKGKYLALIYHDALSDAAKEAYWSAHLDPSTTGERNGGAHFAFLANLVQAHGRDGWAVGSGPSFADVLLFDILDLHERAFGADKVAAAYPELVSVKAKVAEIPGVKAYLESGTQHEKANYNGLG